MLSRALSLAAALAAGAGVVALPRDRSGSSRSQCAFTAEPERTDLPGGFRTFVYTEPLTDELYSEGEIEDGELYRIWEDWVNETVPRNYNGLNPFNQTEMLQHQREIFAGAGYDVSDFDVILNGTIVAPDGEGPALNPINCIESLTWGLQNFYHPLIEDPTEYGAYILEDENSRFVRVYLQTGPSIGVPALSWADDAIKADIAEGWSIRAFLHLHPFVPDNIRYQDPAGTCIPSSGDLGFFHKDVGRFGGAFAEAWITNGLNSIRFSMNQLDEFTGKMALKPRYENFDNRSVYSSSSE
jgi:hypothetical protein